MFNSFRLPGYGQGSPIVQPDTRAGASQERQPVERRFTAERRATIEAKLAVKRCFTRSEGFWKQVQLLYERGFDENQIISMANHRGGLTCMNTLAEKLPRLMDELGFTTAEIRRMANHEGSNLGIQALLANYADLSKMFNNEQISHIYARKGMAKWTDRTLKYTKQLTEREGMQANDVADILVHNMHHQVLELIANNIQLLRNLGWSNEKIVLVARKPKGHKEIGEAIQAAGNNPRPDNLPLPSPVAFGAGHFPIQQADTSQGSPLAMQLASLPSSEDSTDLPPPDEPTDFAPPDEPADSAPPIGQYSPPSARFFQQTLTQQLAQQRAAQPPSPQNLPGWEMDAAGEASLEEAAIPAPALFAPWSDFLASQGIIESIVNDMASHALSTIAFDIAQRGDWKRLLTNAEFLYLASTAGGTDKLSWLMKHHAELDAAGKDMVKVKELVLSGRWNEMNALLKQVKESPRAQPNERRAASSSGRPLPEGGEEPAAKRGKPWRTWLT